jgi:soluble P-type ATPase
MRVLINAQLDGEGAMDDNGILTLLARHIQERSAPPTAPFAPSPAAPSASRPAAPSADSDAGSRAASVQSSAAQRVTPKSQVHVYWDFDQFYGWHCKDVEKLYLALVDYLVQHDPDLQRNQVQTVAVGTNYTFQSPEVIKTLQDMQVHCEVTSSAGETIAKIKQRTELLLKKAGQLTTEVVLIFMDDVGMDALVTPLEDDNMRVLAVHNGATSEASSIVRLSDLIDNVPLVPVPSRNVSVKSTSNLSTLVRSVGRLIKWSQDKVGKFCGFIECGTDTVFLHSALVVRGNPAINCRVSFRAETNPKNPAQQQAYDAVVLEDGEEVGTVSKWGQTDKHGMPFGFVAVGDASHYLATNDLAGSAPAVGDEMVFRVASSVVRPGTTQAKNAMNLNLRRDGASHAPAAAVAPAARPLSMTARSQPPPPPSQTGQLPPREFGKVTRWSTDKGGKYFGFILHGRDTLFLHSGLVVHGTPSVNCRVSFRIEPSPKTPGQRQAYDAVVLADDEEVGSVIRWDQKDKHGMPFGFLSEGGTNHFLATNDLAGGVPSVGDEMVFRVVNSVVRPGTTQAKNAVILKLRDRVAPPAATAPPPPPPTAPAPSARTQQSSPLSRAKRSTGKITRWSMDKSGKHFGFVLCGSQSIFLHSALVVHGKPAVESRVSFRSEASPKTPSQQQAYDAVVLADDETVGTVMTWGQTDKHGMSYGFVTVGDSSHYLASNDLVGSAPSEGDEMVFRLVSSVARPGTTQAKNAAVLRLRH